MGDLLSIGGGGGSPLSLINANAGTAPIGSPCYVSSTGHFNLAEGNGLASASPIAGLLIAATLTGATGSLQDSGQMTLTTGQWDAIAGTVGGLSSPAEYYLDPATPGMITSVAPSTPGQVVASIGFSVSATTMIIRIKPPVLVVAPSSGGWISVLSSTLQSGSLTGWNQRNGAWTADGVGFHSPAAGVTTENYLSYETGGVANAPFPMAAMAMQVEIAWAAAATTTSDIGLVLRGTTGVIDAGAVRFAMRRDGSAATIDIFGAGLFSSVNPALGTMTTGVFHTLRVEAFGANYAIYWDNVLLQTAEMQSKSGATPVTSYTALRCGLWAGTGDAIFRNLKIWRIQSPL